MGRGKLRAIKKKVEATKSLMKITRAMEMVARAKVRKFEREYRKFKEYLDELERIKEKLPLKELESPLAVGGDKTAILVIAADMGLCGAFNTEINKAAEERANKIADFAGFIAIGYKAVSHFRKKNLMKGYEKLYDMPSMKIASEIADHVISLVKSGEVGKVEVVYGKFINALIQRPRIETLIPVEVGKGDENIEYEPSVEKMMDSFLYFYISSKILNYMFETKVSEYYARQNAMKNATDNANEMIRTLTLEYNKARQASITQEIIEIVNGAEALKEIEEAG
jgi:F-type H+-transporting ATPase subunit gamma